MRHHIFEPVSRDDFHVVVQKTHKLSVRLINREVVNRGIVERLGILEHSNAGARQIV